MEELIISTYLRLIKPLRLEVKLKLLTRLSASLQDSHEEQEASPEDLLNELAGSWKDMPASLSDDMMAARTISDKNLEW